MRKKRYGPVKNRGIGRVRLEIIRTSKRYREANKQDKNGPLFCTIIKGTFVRVRKEKKEWIEHVTKEEICYKGVPDSDETHYYLNHLGWKIKVRKDDVIFSRV